MTPLPVIEAWLIFVGSVGLTTGSRCEELHTLPCKQIGYNWTVFPNFIGHGSQEEAAQHLALLLNPADNHCSPDLPLFLCTVFAPACFLNRDGLRVPPCRDLCHAVRMSCSNSPSLNQLWSDVSCSSFPKYLHSADSECVMVQLSQPTGHSQESEATYVASLDQAPAIFNFRCPVQLQTDSDRLYMLHFSHESVTDCGMPCYPNVTFYDANNVASVRQSLFYIALLTCTSTFIAVVACVIDRSRLRYPERPIVFMAVSHFMIGLGYVISLLHGDSIACNSPRTNHTMNFVSESTVKQGSIDDWRCMLSGLWMQFFVTASCLWWLVLACTWFLSTCRQWAREAIANRSQQFHAFVWTTASISCFVATIGKIIEGDSLSGICQVVTLWSASWTFASLTIVPQLVAMVTTFGLLTVVAISSIRLRSAMLNIDCNGERVDNVRQLDRVFLRMAVFTVAYAAACVLFWTSTLVISWLMPNWMDRWQDDTCRHSVLSVHWQMPCPAPVAATLPWLQPLHVMTTKHVALLTMGIVSGAWIWTYKTAKSIYSCLTSIRPPNAPCTQPKSVGC